MNQYIDLITYLQTELGDAYHVSSEQNLDDSGKINVIVKALAGNVFEESANIPYQIDVFTDNPDAVILDLTKFAELHNNKAFTNVVGEKIYNIIPYFNTPTIMESNIDFRSNHFVRITVFANIFVMFAVASINKIEIDDEEEEALNLSIAYNTEMHSRRVSGGELNKNRKKSASVSINFIMINRDNIFTRKISLIRQGKLIGNNVFNFKIKFTNGVTENYKMILSSSTMAWNRTSLPSINLSFLEYDEE